MAADSPTLLGVAAGILSILRQDVSGIVRQSSHRLGLLEIWTPEESRHAGFGGQACPLHFSAEQ